MFTSLVNIYRSQIEIFKARGVEIFTIFPTGGYYVAYKEYYRWVQEPKPKFLCAYDIGQPR